MDWRTAAILAHVLSASWFVAGYVGTNVLTEIARRAKTHEARVAALGMSDRFDRFLNQPGGTAVIWTGAWSWWVSGYPLTTPWIIASVVIMLTIGVMGGTYWSRRGRRVNAAVSSGDVEMTRTLLTASEAVLLSRLENAALLIVVMLMVLRPG